MSRRQVSSLTPGRRELLQVMQQLNFGRIERLMIRNGLPIFDPFPTLIREIKFRGENGPRPESKLSDFQLKPEVMELFQLLDEMDEGVIDVLEIKHGLPFRMIVRDPAA